MKMDTAINRLRNTFYRNERKLVPITLAGFALFGAGLAAVGVVDDVRAAVLSRVQRAILYWDDRWTRRVEYGEALVNSGRYAEAVTYLTTLDNAFPAQIVKHKRDRQRERVLRALAHSYAEMGRKRYALDTYRRLVQFDPRNYENHYLLATACLKFREQVEATEHFIRVLAIHPTHLPSVAAHATLHFERGNFAGVVSNYEAYLSAFLVQEVVVDIGNVSAKAIVLVDGLFHDVEIPFSPSQRLTDEFILSTGSFAGELERVALESPLEVGKTRSATPQVWSTAISWNTNERIIVGQDRPRLPRPQHAITKIRLSLRLFKQFDPILWKMVEKSYRNSLDGDGLIRARARSFTAASNGTSH